jgi:salicylate hydroxylase
MPAQLPAGVSLQVLVVGGGLAGIATAFALQRAGHAVAVLERSESACTPSDGGLRSPPNMTRILNHWGLAPRLALTAVKCPQFRFHQADGALLSIVQLHDDFLRDLMADFVFVRHRDLHEMLLELAVQAGVRVRWGAVVKAVDCDQKLVPFMRAVTPTVHVRRPILESSVCERARVVLVGEAAHPVMVSGFHLRG